MTDDIASKCSVAGVTARDGLLWKDGKMLSCVEADIAARSCGFVYAEQLVHHLQGDKPREWGCSSMTFSTEEDNSTMPPSDSHVQVTAMPPVEAKVLPDGSGVEVSSDGEHDTTGVDTSEPPRPRRMMHALAAFVGMGMLDGLDDRLPEPPHAEDVVFGKNGAHTRCLLEGCGKPRGRGGYCCAEHCREDRRREKERSS